MRGDFLCRITCSIIIILILLLPVINSVEIQKHAGFVFIPVDIRSIKDIGGVFIVMLSFINTIFKARFNPMYKILWLFILFLAVAVLYSIDEPFMMILCGLRWFLPMVLFVFIYDFVDNELLIRVYRAMKIAFVIHVSLQFYELFYMKHMYGSIGGSLAARVPGLMALSHSAALFTCMFYMLLDKFERINRVKKIMTILCFVSIMMVMSSTGVCVFCLIYLLGRYGKQLNKHKILYVFIPVVLLVLYMYADNITGRNEGASEISVTTRIRAGIALFQEIGIVSNRFGSVTNGAFIKQDEWNLTNLQFGDSFYNSVIGNFGVMAFLVLVLFIVRAVKYSVANNYNYMLRWIMLFALCSVSTIVTEVFPATIILGIITAFFVKSINQKTYYNLV